MNGASTEPWANTSRAPTTTMTTMIGSSHHFLRARMKAQSSRAKLPRPILAPFLELSFHVGPPPGRDSARDPEAVAETWAGEPVAAGEPSHQTRRRQDHEIDQPQEHRRRDLRDGRRERHPESVHGPEPRRHHERGSDQGAAEPREGPRFERVPAPCSQAREHEEPRTQREPESPP